MAKQKKVTRHRSAKTGRYVTEKYATRHPATTVKETSRVGRNGGGRPPKK